MGSIFNMFGPSPIRPIEQHMHKAYICAKQLDPFFEAVLVQDWAAATTIKNKIVDLETEADLIKRELRLHLPAGLFLPGFRGSEVNIVKEMIVTLDEIEQDSDEKLADLRHRIFKLEKDLTAVEIVFLYKLVQWIGDLADHAQIVGDRLQILIAR